MSNVHIFSTVYVLIIMALTGNLLQADLIKANTQEQFKALLEKNPLSIALFYDASLLEHNKQLKENVLKVIESFRLLSETKKFQDNKLIFLLIDVSDQKLNNSTSQYFELGLPSYVIFIKGEPLHDASGKILIGQAVLADAVTSFINKYVTDQLMMMSQVQSNKNSGQPIELYSSAQDFHVDPYVPEFFWGSFWGPTYP